MPLLFQPTTSLADLGQMNNVPVDMTLEGLNQYRQGQQADQMAMEDLPGLIQHQQNMRPLQEQSLAANSAMTLAQIPGVQAQGRSQTVKANVDEATQEAQVKDILDKYGYEATKRHFDSVSGMGPMIQQAAEIARQNPFGGVQQAKKMFIDAKHEDMWNPQWDNMPWQQVVMQMSETGRNISNATAKTQMILQQAALRGEIQARIEAARIESRENIANGHNQLKRDLAQAELKFKNEHQTPNYQQLGGRYEELARQAYASGNGDYGQQLDQEAQRMFTMARQMPAVAPTISNEGKVDISKLTGGAVPTLNDARVNGAPQADYPSRGGQKPTAQPKTAQEAAAAGWVKVKDANGHIGYVHPEDMVNGIPKQNARHFAE